MRRRPSVVLLACAAVAVALPALAQQTPEAVVNDVGKALKGTIESTAKAVDKAVSSTLSEPKRAKKSKSSKSKSAEKTKAADTESDRQAAEFEAKAKKNAEPGPATDKNAAGSKSVAAPVPAPAPDKAPTPANEKAKDAAAAAPEKKPDVWSEAEITEARTRCTEILKRIHAVAIPEAPLREGACGTPAPIQLISIGKKPEVSISPPAIVNCEFAEKLATWLEGDLQPLARKHLGADLIKIETMSSYSCRSAYGRAQNKLSEHGLANAVDIRGFVAASAKTAMVLEDWGTPEREILARIAAEKAKAEKLAAEKAAAEAAAQKAQAADTSGATGATPPAAVGRAAESAPRDAATGLSLNQPAHLGGPARAAAMSSRAIVDIQVALPGKGEGATSPGTRQFLHLAHDAACRIFGTTLGPEANAAHRNHFHVDMARRKSADTKICD